MASSKNGVSPGGGGGGDKEGRRGRDRDGGAKNMSLATTDWDQRVKYLHNYFATMDDEELLNHEKCISSNFTYIRSEVLQETIDQQHWHSKCALILNEKDSVVVAFKKKPKTAAASADGKMPAPGGSSAGSK